MATNCMSSRCCRPSRKYPSSSERSKYARDMTQYVSGIWTFGLQPLCVASIAYPHPMALLTAESSLAEGNDVLGPCTPATLTSVSPTLQN